MNTDAPSTTKPNCIGSPGAGVKSYTAAGTRLPAMLVSATPTAVLFAHSPPTNWASVQ
ncbi:MAG TPA: hypothetical protein VNY52_00920 [Solirubrobacteraceae bacterium]|nr:hypothetical protein [Solirubrobacteraceae bacterium]